MVNQSRKFPTLEKAVVIEMDKQPGRKRMDYLFFSTKDCLETKIGINC